MMLANNEFESADELDAYLDSLVQGGALQSANVDPAVVESASQFHRLGAIAKPEQRFVLGLEKKLMESSVSVLTPQMPVAPVALPNANGHLPLPPVAAVDAVRYPHLKPILLAAVAALCIASAVAFGAYRLMPPGGSESDEIPAPVVAMQSSPESAGADESGCTVTARTEEQDALRGTPTTDAILEATTIASSPLQVGVGVPAMPEENLPEGEEASAELKSDVGSIILELVACRNAGDWERMDALYSDDSFRRAFGPEGRQESGTPQPEPPPAPITVPAVLDMRVLPDGRVGTLLSHDLSGYGLRHFLIFVNVDGRWLVDEEVIVRPDYESMGLSAYYYTIRSYDLYFDPDRLGVPENENVVLRLENHGMTDHTFVIEELDVELHLEPGEVKTVTIKPPAGTYEFFSDIPGHRAAGMEGEIIVVPAQVVEQGPPVSCNTAVTVVASPEVEKGSGSPVVIHSPATAANSTPVAWEEGCD